MKQSKFTPEEQDKVVKKFYRKVPVSTLSQEFNVSKSTVYNWIKNCKHHYRNKKRESFTAPQVYALERKVNSLQLENDIFIKTGCGIKSPTKDKINAVETFKDVFPPSAICRTLHLSKSTYYSYLSNKNKKTWFAEKAEELKPKILEIFDQSKERFGSGKILIKLKQEGIHTSRPYVDKLMKEM